MMIEKTNMCPKKLQWLFIETGNYKTEFHVPQGSINQMHQYK